MSKPSKAGADKFTQRERDPSVEEIINYWTDRPQKEDLCAIVNCYNKHITECKKCTNYYCRKHFKSHLDIVLDR